MASVFLAEDPSLGRLVAIKVIHSHLAGQADLLTRFTSEAKTAAALRSPNIVEIFDYGIEAGAQYLVMEYIDGPTLQHVLNLQMGEPLSPELAACLAVQAAEGLMVAERKGVVHRDIKPENLMLTSHGLLKIADFGIAHINEQNLTRTGSLLGSPSYMAPEQVEGQKPSHQTDMFALGAVFYACLTGRKPFNGPNIPAIFRAICELPHKPVEACVPDLDPKLIELSSALLNKKPEERGGGAKVLAGQLRQWLNQRGIYDPSEPVQNLLTTVQDAANRTMVEGGSSASAAAPAPAKPEPAKPEQKAAEPAPSAASKVPATPASASQSAPASAHPASSLEEPVSMTGFWDENKPEPVAAASEKKDPAKPPKEKAGSGKAGPEKSVAGKAKSEPTFESAPADSSGSKQARALPSWAIPAGAGAALLLVVGILFWALGGDDEVAEPESKPQPTVQAQVAPTTNTNANPIADTNRTASSSATSNMGDTSAAQTIANTVTSPDTANLSNTSTTTASPATSPSATVKPGDSAAAQAQPDSTELHITSAPPFAEVFLGTRFMGTTPFKKTVPATRYKILLNHRRFVSVDTVVRLKPGKTTLKFRFTEAKPQ